MLRYAMAALLLLPWISRAGEDRYFICVGVDAYSSPLITSLRGAENDARLVAAALTKYGGFVPQGKGSWLLSTTTETAGKNDVLAAIAAVATTADKDDAFVFFFAGHGIIRNETSYLLTRDSDIREDAIAQTGLSAEALREAISAIPSEKKLVILDACRNDPLPSRSGAAALSEEFVRGLQVVPAMKIPRIRGKRIARFTATLYSCGPNERAFERPFETPVHGFFSFYLFEGLKRASTAGKPYSIKELATELEEKVSAATKKALGVSQEPWVEISGRYLDDWSITTEENQTVEEPVFLQPKPPPETTAVKPPAVKRASLRIVSDPEGADILVNGRSTRKETPALLADLEAGNTVVTLKKRGYRTTVKELRLDPDTAETLSVKMTRQVTRRVRVH